MANARDFCHFDPLKDATPSPSHLSTSHAGTGDHEDALFSVAATSTSFARSDIIDLTTSGKDSPVVSSVRRKAAAGMGEKQIDATSRVSSSATSRPNARASGYIPGSYSKRVKSASPGSSYVPGSYSQQMRQQKSMPTDSNSKAASNAKVNLSTTSTATCTASSLISFDMPLYSSSIPPAPLTAEPAVTVMEPFELPTSGTDHELNAPETAPSISSAMHVANPAATLDDPTNLEAMEVLMKKLDVTGSARRNNKMGEARCEPRLSAREVLTAAGVDINFDNLEATHDGKAPLELVGSFLTCVMNQKYEAALILCQRVLRFEPENETAREFYPVIVEKIHRDSFGSDSNSSDSSEDEESSEESDESDSSESESNSEGISSSEQEDEAGNEHMTNASLPPSQPLQ